MSSNDFIFALFSDWNWLITSNKLFFDLFINNSIWSLSILFVNILLLLLSLFNIKFNSFLSTLFCSKLLIASLMAWNWSFTLWINLSKSLSIFSTFFFIFSKETLKSFISNLLSIFPSKLLKSFSYSNINCSNSFFPKFLFNESFIILLTSFLSAILFIKKLILFLSSFVSRAFSISIILALLSNSFLIIRKSSLFTKLFSIRLILLKRSFFKFSNRLIKLLYWFILLFSSQLFFWFKYSNNSSLFIFWSNSWVKLFIALNISSLFGLNFK